MPNDFDNDVPGNGNYNDDDINSVAEEMNGVSLNAHTPSTSGTGTPKSSIPPPPVTAFFKSFEGPMRYIHNPFATPEAEFTRLAQLRGWGKRLRAKHRKTLDQILSQSKATAATAASSAPSPIELFLRAQEHPNSSFKFQPNTHPATQWHRLRKSRGFKGNDLSPEYISFRSEWFSAVEDDLNDLVPDDAPNVWSWVCFILELITPDEYAQGITVTRARKLVCKVFVNIYDFDHWARGGYKGGIGGLKTFTSRRALGRYTKRKDLAFPKEVAKKDGKDGVARWLLHDFRRLGVLVNAT